jgi:hypothetical protein
MTFGLPSTLMRDSRKQQATNAILCAFAAMTLLLIALRPGSLHILFPALATVTGAVLLWSSPRAYISFTFWCWILTPLFRRIIDFRSDIVEPSPVLLAPLLVTGLAGFKAVGALNRRSREAVPYLMFIAAIFLALAIGLLTNPLKKDVVQAFLSWIVPVLWGLYVAFGNVSREEGQELICRNFTLAVLVMGLYGVLQYVAPPAWDLSWLQSVIDIREATSFGRPEPFLIRVWSTANGPGVFAFMMMNGLLLLFVRKSKIRFLAGLAGGLAFILSSVRISWIGFVIGLILLCVWARGRRMQLVIGLIVSGAVLASVVAVSQFQESVLTRFETFQNLEQDGSLQERLDTHVHLLNIVSTHPFGLGLFTDPPDRILDPPIDSGIFRIILIFGWAGAAAIGLALLQIVLATRRGTELSPMSVWFRVAVIAMLAHLPSGDVFAGPQGYLFWTAVSLAAAKWEASSKKDDPRVVPVYNTVATY